jgi:predicted aminopeptidase
VGEPSSAARSSAPLTPAAAASSSAPLAPAATASATAHAASSALAARSASRTKRSLTSLPFRLLALARLAPLAAAAALGTGCYVGHLAAGQTRLLLARQPVDALIASPATPPDLAERLRLVGDARAFAGRIGLDVGEQYTSYVDVPGDRVVTTVVATRPGEVDAATFWFPVVGRVPYKGFFDVARAEAEARRLGEQGLDTCLVPVRAYSTLGWLADPLTAPMARLSPSRLAETVIHELLHATAYVGSEPEWNEGVATFVGQEGAARFFAEREGPGGESRERVRIEEDRRVGAALQAFRERVRALYASTPAGPARDAARAELERAARAELAALPLVTRDAALVAESVRLNDACQALTGTYQSDLPAYAAALAAMGGDLRRFVERARAAADQDDPRSALVAAEP